MIIKKRVNADNIKLWQGMTLRRNREERNMLKIEDMMRNI